MEYVSKEVAKIAKKRGYITGSDTDWYYKLEYQQLIEWIFKDNVKDITLLTSDTKSKEYLKSFNSWLEFWYNTLIPELIDTKEFVPSMDYSTPINEFVLEGFVGMLLNWFEKSNIIILFKYDFITYDVTILKYGLDPINLVSTLSERTPYCFTTKNQARHETILQVFKLLKEE